MLLFGVVNQSLPASSNTRKIGWLPGMAGSVWNWTSPVAGFSAPICPGGVSAAQVGRKSHPGSANQIVPEPSTAIPHGYPTPADVQNVLIGGSAAPRAAGRCLNAGDPSSGSTPEAAPSPER